MVIFVFHLVVHTCTQYICITAVDLKLGQFLYLHYKVELGFPLF